MKCHRTMESWSVGRDLRDQVIPLPCHRQEHLPQQLYPAPDNFACRRGGPERVQNWGESLEKKGKAFSTHLCNYKWNNHSLKENLFNPTPQVPCAGVSCVLTEGQERHLGWSFRGEMEEITISSTTHCVTL